MDVEFHYYITYLLAVRAGFPPAEARTLAYACQAVDDNKIWYRISGGSEGDYDAHISQTLDITKPAEALYEVYPVFHFVPWCGVAEGDARCPSPRKIGEWTKDTVAPNNLLAQKMMQNALDLPESSDTRLFRIGIASHAYADTWAHQNFLGKKSDLNSVPVNTDRKPGDVVEYRVENLINIGHGACGHSPDIPNLIWEDTRLIDPHVDNKARFLDAAAHLFRFFIKDRDPHVTEQKIQSEIEALQNDIGEDIGSESTTKGERIDNYRNRALRSEYSYELTPLPLYNEDVLTWADEATEGVRQRLLSDLEDVLCEQAGGLFQTQPILARWHDPSVYEKSNWYRFLEAVKQHQEIGLSILKDCGIVPVINPDA